MKYIDKTQNRKQRMRFWAVVLSITLAVVLTASIVVTNLVNRTSDQTTVDTSTIEILEGEARQSGLALAYPTFTSSLQIEYIVVFHVFTC